MLGGLCTLQGRVYRPNVVRVGSEEAPLSARARDVWVDGLIRRYMDMEQPGMFPAQISTFVCSRSGVIASGLSCFNLHFCCVVWLCCYSKASVYSI